MPPVYLRNDRQGAVSILFAGAAVPLIGLLGLAIDYSFVTQARTQMALAADTAAMTSIKIASNEFVNSGSSSNYISDGEANGVQWYNAQLGALRGASSNTPTVLVSRQNVNFTSTVTYSGQVPTHFSAIFGFSDFNVAGASVANIALNAYVNIALLLDNSSSMLIGSTAADINTMQTITPCSQAASGSAQGMGAWTGPTPAACPNGKTAVAASYAPCGFACHWSATAPDYYYLARNNPIGMTPAGTKPQPPGTPAITLRFDVVQSASEQVITAMANSEVISNQFGLTVFEFNSALTKVYPTAASGLEYGYDLNNNDGASGLAAVQAITTPVVVNNGDTDFPDSMTTVATQLTAGGDGSTSASPRKNLFIVTDGIQDYGSRQVGSTEGPFANSAAVAACNKIKSMGIAIYVLYTPYTPLVYNPYYVSNIAQYVNTPPSPNGIVTALQACASSATDFYEADVPSQVATGLQTLLKAAVKTAARISS